MLRASHEPQMTDTYVSDLSRRLKRGLPREKAGQIAQETRAHLSDRVSELVEQGVSHPEAEARAVAGFGPVRRYAHTATLAAYGSRTTGAWRLVGRLATLNVLAFALSAVVLPDSAVSFFLTITGLLSLLLIPIAALFARQPQTRTYLGYHAVAACILFLGTGFMYVPNRDHLAPTQGIVWYSPLGRGVKRQDYTRQIQSERELQAFHQDELKQLEQGFTVYQTNAPVPAALRVGDRYIVPGKALGWRTTSVFTLDYGRSALRQTALQGRDLDLPPNGPRAKRAFPFSGFQRNRYFAEYPYYTVASRRQAAQVWKQRVPEWRAEKRFWITKSQRLVQRLQQVDGAPYRFNTTALTFYLPLVTWGTPILILLDFVLAHLGRAVWIVFRNCRRTVV